MKLIRSKLSLVLGSFLLLFLFLAIPASAAIWDSIWTDGGGEDTVEFLTKYEDYLSYGNFLSVIGHMIGWPLVKGMYWITTGIEGLVPQTFDLLTVLQNAGFQSITAAIINDLVVALMVLVLVFIGFKTIIAKEPPNFKSVGVNIFISAFLIMGLPTLINMMQDISLKFYDATQTGNNNEGVESLSWGLIQDNTTDLLYVSQKGFSILDSGTTVKNGLTPDTFGISNLNALITPDTISNIESTEIEHLAYRLDTDENGSIVADKVVGGAFSFFTDAFQEGYFRYHVNFFPILVGLTALIVAYVFALFVIATTIIEICFKQVIGVIVFATDLESGQKTKMVVRDLMNAFLLIAFTGLSMQMYTMFLSYLAVSNVHVAIYLIAVVSATFVLIKGSSTIMRYFGVDVGLKEGMAQMAGAFALGRVTAGGVSGGMNKLRGLGGGKGGDSGSPMTEAQEGLGQYASAATSINNAAKPRITPGLGAKRNAGVGSSLKENLQEKLSPIQATSDSVALAGLAGATAAGVGQSADQEKRRPIENQSLKEALGGQNAFSTLDKGQNVSEKERKQAQNGVQGTELPNGLQNSSSKNPEDLQNGLKGNHGETSINDGNGRSTQDILTNAKLNEAMQPNMKDSTGQMNMKAQMDGTPSGSEVMGAMKMATENHDADGNLNMRTQATQPSISEQGEMQKNRPLLNQTERLEADMKVNSPGINQRGEMASDTKFNASDIATPSVANHSADMKFNASEQVSPNVASQSADVKFNPSGMNQKGEMTADMKVNPSSTNVSPVSAIAPNQAVQRVLQQVEKTSFSNPESATQSIIQQVQQGSFGTTDQKQNIIQEITNSSSATPQQMQQNVQQVLSTARLPKEAQNAVQRVIQDVQGNPSQSPETLKTRVIQELEQASFGTREPIKQFIMQDIQRAFSATPEQTQQNIKQVLQKAEKSSPEQTQQTIKQVIERTENTVVAGNSRENKSGYFGSLFGEVPTPQPIERKGPSRFDFIKKTNKGATE